MTRRILLTILIAFVQFSAGLIAFALAFSRGMNEAPRTWFDDALGLAGAVLSFPLGSMWSGSGIAAAIANSLLWGVLLVFAGSLWRRFVRAPRLAA